ncbi:MAG TPA: pyruvate formate-lyase-activating protein [Burkholderiales bacterium]|nr:pyruvate formate-lyase-activating protein [Burkholderiales bacterium]
MDSSNDLPSRSRYELFVAKAAPARAGAAYFDVHETDDEPVAEKSDDELIGYIHSAQLGTTVDGPGIRLVVFLTGCLLRCQYCHNPDTWHKHNGKPYSAAHAMGEISKYADVLKISKGGITLSGGEPMVQTAFTTRIFRRCKELGLHTCLDTSGRMGERLNDAQLMDVDLNLLDIKSGDPEIYQRLTRHPLQPTLDYARRLSDLGRAMWLRFVLVPGLTDGYDNVQRVADFCAGLKTLERVEILRFHQLGRSKWAKLGIDYPLKDAVPPSNELTERVRGQFRSRGLTVY